MSKTKMLKKTRRKEFRENHPAIQKWLSNLAPETSHRYLIYGYEYFKWIEKQAPEPFKGKSPEELLDMQDQAPSVRKSFEQVDLLLTWLISRKGAYKTKLLQKSVIYSFYASNRVPLPSDTTLYKKLKPDRAPVDGFLSVEEIKQVILSSNELYSAVFTIMFQSGMGCSEFLYFNGEWKQIKGQLETGKQVIRVNLQGRKHRALKPSSSFFTFFGKDAITKLKQYLDYRKQLVQRENNAEKQPNLKREPRNIPTLEKAIFINEKFKPITRDDISSYFKRHCWKLGVTKKIDGDKRARYRAHVHELRDTLRTEWSVIPNVKPVVCEFILGHVVDSNDYNKLMNRPEFVQEQYELALPYLNILSEDPRTIRKQDLEKQIRERVKEALKEKDKEIQELRQNGNVKTTEIAELRKEFQELRERTILLSNAMINYNARKKLPLTATNLIEEEEETEK